MLKGIDISNWQAGLRIGNLQGVQFAIMKATEGTTFVDKCCDGWVSECKQLGMPWGFYHFARENSPVSEAAHFINNTSNYFSHGIPVLDWEGEQSVAWVNEFVRKVHEQTGIWPWIYGNPWRFNQGGVEPNCARWVASYPPVTRPGLDYNPGATPQTDGLVACWQFASDGAVPGYSGNLDINEFYGDANSWLAYAGASVPAPEPSPEPEPQPTTSVLENSEYRVTIEPK